MHTTYANARFTSQVDKALTRIRLILDTNRDPTYPADVPHEYKDKYILSNFLTNTALASQLICMELLGLTGEQLQQLKTWSKNRTITLQLSSTEKCTFDKKASRKVESDTKHVTEIKVLGAAHKITDKVVTTVTEYFWKFQVHWCLSAYYGTEEAQKLVFRERTSQYEIVTGSELPPQPVIITKPPIEVDITWLFQNLSDSMTLNFSIDRTATSCRTPRRNPAVQSALSHFVCFYDFVVAVEKYFRNSLFPIQSNHGLDVQKINAEGLFTPVVPLFEESAKSRALNSCKEKAIVSIEKEESDAVLQVGDVNHFLVEEKRSLLEKISEMEKMFPASDKAKIISSTEAVILVALLHAKDICQHYADGVNYIEVMLRRQLIAAIGKEISGPDFVAYMTYHNRSLFKAEYEPRPFSYGVRRPAHDPEGILTIDTDVGGNIPTPIQTTVRHTKAKKPMYIQINAATKVFFTGDRYLHGWITHTFSGAESQSLSLNARARQFSSFILLLGKVTSADQFEPEHALIIQNKDDLKIPLSLESVPAPTSEGSIDSLSPEQQSFCKAYRGMQLANTLFSVAVIQIKPQLEKLLNLPEDSLTKEIQLTQDLLQLILKYQIPGDLLSYEGTPKADQEKKLSAVKGHVSALQEMIALAKQNELEEQERVLMMAKATRPTNVITPSFGSVRPQPRQYYSKPSTSSGGQPKTKSKAIVEDEEDYTQMPKQLDRMFHKFDQDRALKANIIKPEDGWTRIAQKALLAAPAPAHVDDDWIHQEKNKAYDLIDGLTRSGALPLDYFDLHVVLAATHCFDSTLIDTVIKENINPIEKAERSTLILASAVHGKPPQELLRDDHVERIGTRNPQLLQ